LTYTLDLTLFCPWARRSVILGKLLIETESGKSISELVAEVFIYHFFHANIIVML